jgi:hypothetical protein
MKAVSKYEFQTIIARFITGAGSEPAQLMGIIKITVR